MAMEVGATRTPDGSRRGTDPIGAALRLLGRPVWLPRRVYAAVPWFYLGSGGASLLGGLFLTDGTWFLPYLLLLGGACLHAAVALASMRQANRARARQRAAGAADGPLVRPAGKLPE